MNPYLYLLGHPYNPASNEYFEELPSSVKSTGTLKKIIKNNYNKLTEDDFTSYIAESTLKMIGDTDPSNFLYIKFDDSEIDTELYRSELRRLYSLAKKTHPKGVNRLVLSYLPPYTDIIDEYYSDNGFKLTPKWLSPMMKQGENAEEFNKRVGLILNEDDSVQDGIPYELEKSDGSDKAKLKEQILTDKEIEVVREICLFMDSDSMEYGMIARFFLAKAIRFARNEKTYNKALELIWTLARKESDVEIIIIFYRHYKKIITKKRFPFLHIANIKLMSDKLENYKRNGLDIFSGRKLTKLSDDVESTITGTSNIESILDAREKLNKVSNYPSKTNLMNYAKEKFISIKDRYLKNENTPGEIVTQIKRISIVEPENNLNFDNYNGLLSLLSNLDAISHYTTKTIFSRNLVQEKNKLNSKAVLLGKSPLDNIVELQEISEKVKLLTETIDEATSKAIDMFISVFEDLEKSISKLNIEDNQALEVSKPKESTTNVNNEKLDIHEHEVDNLKSELSGLKSKLHNKELMVKGMEDNLRHNLQPIKCTISTSELSELLSSPSVDLVVDAVNKINGTIVLSPKAKQEMSNLTLFLKHDLLMQKLGILTSQKFINAYTTKGSSACFEFMTNKELSFQESKTVKGRNDRQFKFSDGKTRDCKAHLKICSNTKEQYQLRIYFKIEANKVYIGMITKHLDC